MKAVRIRQCGDPGVMDVEEVPDLSPGPAQIVIAVRAAGVNPVDTYIRSGQYNRAMTFPYTPGFDAAGTVLRAGRSVSSWVPGQRVFVAACPNGTYAEQVLCTVDEIFPLPDAMTFAQGAAIGIPYATAYKALFTKAKAVAGETVLIHGASGGVGTAALQLARMRGLKTIATAGSPHGLDLVKRLGAHHVFNHRQPGYLDAIYAATEDRGADIILEMLADVNLPYDLKIIAPFGRIVVIGCRGPATIEPRDIMTWDAVVTGLLFMHTPLEERRGIYAALGEALASQKLDPVIGQTFPLSEARKAHEAVMKPGAFGKIVLTVP